MNINSKPKITIIIPIYNAEKYIERCLRSIVEQSFNDFEVIIINDGSTDSSLKICNEFKEIDRRIKVLSQKNQGASVARNLGLLNSEGNYIINFDADDWIEKDMLETLYSTAIKENADIVACSFFINYPDKKEKIWQYPYVDEKKEQLLKIEMGYSALWNKLIRRDLIINNNIRGVSGITMWDDNVITLPLRILSKKTICIDRPLYHYWIGNNDSICNKFKNVFPNSEISCVKYLQPFFQSLKSDTVAKRSYSNIKVMAKDRIMSNTELGGIKAWKECLKINVRDIVNSQISANRKLIRILLHLLPSKLGQIIVDSFIKGIK